MKSSAAGARAGPGLRAHRRSAARRQCRRRAARRAGSSSSRARPKRRTSRGRWHRCARCSIRDGAVAPGVAIERDLDPSRRPPVAALDQPHLPGEARTLFQENQIRQRERQREAAIARLGERALGGGDDEIEHRTSRAAASTKVRCARKSRVGGSATVQAATGSALAIRRSISRSSFGKRPRNSAARQLRRRDRPRRRAGGASAGCDGRSRSSAGRRRRPPSSGARSREPRSPPGARDRAGLRGCPGRPSRPSGRARARECGVRRRCGRGRPRRASSAMPTAHQGSARKCGRRRSRSARRTAWSLSEVRCRASRPLARQTRLELGAELAAVAVPALEVGEHEGGAQQWMDGMDGMGGLGCCRLSPPIQPRRRLRRVGQEVLELELPAVVRLARRPEARVGEQPVDEEVGQGVAQRAADALRIVVGREVGEVADGDAAQRLPAFPDREEAALGLVRDLLGGPRLEIELGCPAPPTPRARAAGSPSRSPRGTRAGRGRSRARPRRGRPTRRAKAAAFISSTAVSRPPRAVRTWDCRTRAFAQFVSSPAARALSTSGPRRSTASCSFCSSSRRSISFQAAVGFMVAGTLGIAPLASVALPGPPRWRSSASWRQEEAASASAPAKRRVEANEERIVKILDPARREQETADALRVQSLATDLRRSRPP